jgi:hypothetical protein
MMDLRSDLRRFGGAMILLSGDFHQTLPIIPKSITADKLNKCLKSSSLWFHVEKLKLTMNMRVELQNDPSGSIRNSSPKCSPELQKIIKISISERAILTAKNKDVDSLIFIVQG